jgi:hypothetical protein
MTGAHVGAGVHRLGDRKELPAELIAVLDCHRSPVEATARASPTTRGPILTVPSAVPPSLPPEALLLHVLVQLLCGLTYMPVQVSYTMSQSRKLGRKLQMS